jgi:hypothetical protein
MIFPDDIRQDIKAFWGIPLGKMLKILVPLGVALAGFILWFPFPDIVWRMGLAIAVFVVVSGSMALNLPRFFGIYQRYRQRPKLIQSQPGVKSLGNELTCLQDLIRADRLHYDRDKVLIEWDNGWISVLCQVCSEPIDFESPATIVLIQKGIKDALAVASANSLRLAWIEDADFEHDQDVWDDWREQALGNIMPGGRDLTLDRMDKYEALAKHEAVKSRFLLRIDASLTHFMREENGETDFERKERALATFSHTAGSLINNLSSAKLHLTPMGEEDLAWIIQQEVAPWTRGKMIDPQDFAHELYEDEASTDFMEEPSTLELEEDPIDDNLSMVPEMPEDNLANPGVHGLNDLEQKTPPPQTSYSPNLAFPIQPIKNPFKKKPLNPFAKDLSQERPISGKTRQKVVPLVKPIQFPNNIVVVFGTKRYVGVTTVAANLTPSGGLLINLGRGEQPLKWPEHFSVWPVSGDHRVNEIVAMAETFDQVTVDLGLYTEDCLDVLKAAQNVIYVTDNQPNTLGASLQQTEALPTDKMMLAINKAMPSGLSPGLLSAQLGMPIGIMIPFDSSYDDHFGLSLPRKPWEIVRRLIKDREEACL